MLSKKDMEKLLEEMIKDDPDATIADFIKMKAEIEDEVKMISNSI